MRYTMFNVFKNKWMCMITLCDVMGVLNQR